MAKSDIEIAREASMQPITEVGEKLGIPAEALLQYGPHKGKLSFDFINSLQDRPDGKLILVTAITPTPAGEGKTTTTVGLGDGLNAIGKNAARWFPWRTLTCTSPATSTPSGSRTTCSRPFWTTTSTGATSWASTSAAFPGSAWWT